MTFSIQTREELQRRMIARLVARTALSDLAPGDPMTQLTGGVASELEELYIAVASLLELFNIDGATGGDLDAKAAEVLPDGLLRGGATRATGTLRWSTSSPVAVDVVIPSGTVAARAGSPRQLFETTAPGRIAAGSTQSERTDGVGGDIPGAAVSTGAAGNSDPDSVRIQVSQVTTATAVTNPGPFRNGAESESDGVFRGRIRAHIRTLSRCISEALEERASSAEIDGRRVVVSRVWEDPVNRGNVVIYIDDGTGQIAETAQGPAEEFTDSVAGAVGGEQEFYVRNWPVRGAIGVTLITAAGDERVLVSGTDYVQIPARGLVWLHPTVFPTGLAAGDHLSVAPYTHYIGLIRLAQLLVEGRASDRVNYPSWRAAGVVVTVMAPTVRQALVSGLITVGAGADRPSVLAAVRGAVANYCNGLGVGDSVIKSEIIERAMAVPGMFDFALTSPQDNVPVLYNEVARLTTANNTIV